MSASFASPLGKVMLDYLQLKQALGRRYDSERRVLETVDQLLVKKKARDLDSDAFTAWCQTQAHLASGVRRWRMRVVRNFCLYRRRTKPECFLPDLDQFPAQHQRVRPHIFSEQEIARLLRAASSLRPAWAAPLRSQTFRLAIVLLYTAGLRRGELLRLRLGDYDSRQDTLLIRVSKFHKSRVVPLSADAARELRAYLAVRRARGCPMGADSPLMFNRRCGGHAYTGVGLRRGISELLEAAHILTSAGRLPRIHDFRHAFAVQALVRWYRAGVDVQSRLPFLAAYMGHVSIVSTQYYLAFIEPLALEASKRFAGHCRSLIRVRHAGGRS